MLNLAGSLDPVEHPQIYLVCTGRRGGAKPSQYPADKVLVLFSCFVAEITAIRRTVVSLVRGSRGLSVDWQKRSKINLVVATTEPHKGFGSETGSEACGRFK